MSFGPCFAFLISRFSRLRVFGLPSSLFPLFLSSLAESCFMTGYFQRVSPNVSPRVTKGGKWCGKICFYYYYLFKIIMIIYSYANNCDAPPWMSYYFPYFWPFSASATAGIPRTGICHRSTNTALLALYHLLNNLFHEKLNG